MGWTNTQPDEVTAPGSVPFLPGNNVTGFGSQLPPELAAAGYTSAIVFYSTDWDPASTKAKTKFEFIGRRGGSLVIGMGYCVNPSVSQVATITRICSIGLITNGAGTIPLTDFELFDANNNANYQFSQLADGSGFPYFMQFDDSGNPLHDSNWQSVTLLNGYTAYPAGVWYSGLRVRRFPFGGVQLNGTIATPGGTPNQVIANVPAFYRPIYRMSNICNVGAAAIVSPIHALPSGDIFVDTPPASSFININVWWMMG